MYILVYIYLYCIYRQNMHQQVLKSREKWLEEKLKQKPYFLQEVNVFLHLEGPLCIITF